MFRSLYTCVTTTQINTQPVTSTPQAASLPHPVSTPPLPQKQTSILTFLYLNEVLALFINGIIQYILSYAWLLCNIVPYGIHPRCGLGQQYVLFPLRSSIPACEYNRAFLLAFGLFPICRSYKQCRCEHPVGPLCTYAVIGVGSASQEWSRWVVGWAYVSLIGSCETVVRSGCTSSIPTSTESPSCSISSLILDTILLLFMNLFQPVW